MQLIRIDYEYTHRLIDNDSCELISKSIRQGSIRVVVADSHHIPMAECYCDTRGGHKEDEGYKRLATVDEGRIDVILPSPQHRI